VLKPSLWPGARTFLTIWTGQTISLLGSAMAAFAVGVWTFQRTGSVTKFSLILFFGTAPIVLMAPLAGPLVDRWDRRTALLVGQVGGGLSALTMALLFFTGRLEIWHIYVLVALAATTQSFRWPALSASIVLLVPPRDVSRANGMLQLGMALSQTFAPMIAGALLAPLAVGGILLLDVASFVAAILTLLAVRIPRPPALPESERRKPLLVQFADGWRYLWARRELLSLLLLFAACNFTVGLVMTLLTPMVLGFADTRVLGVVLGVGGAGLLAGGALMTAWRGFRRRIDGVLWPMLAQGVVLLFLALRPSAVLVAAGLFLFVSAVSIVNASSQAIWQGRVAPELQGRVFALRQMVALSTLPLSRLVAGPLADHVFEPLLAPGGALADSVGRLVGVGPGRGIALLFTIVGACYLAIVLFAWSSPRLRRVEGETVAAGQPLAADGPAPAIPAGETSRA
jgi:MFS family permease